MMAMCKPQMSYIGKLVIDLYMLLNIKWLEAWVVWTENKEA